MLAERVREWTRPWVEQGHQKGLEEGIEQGIEQGIQQGIERGLQNGVREGETSILRRLLEIRFGPLPEMLVQRIEAAASEERLVWSERLLRAATLDEVFAAD